MLLTERIGSACSNLVLSGAADGIAISNRGRCRLTDGA